MLHQLVVAREGLETLLTLVGLYLGSASDAFSSKLHCRLCHQILKQKWIRNELCTVNRKSISVLFFTDRYIYKILNIRMFSVPG